MGNCVGSEIYFPKKNESIINLSDNCVGRITNEERQCAKSKPSKLDEGEWAKKLKCMDDIHTQENGLTYQCVLELIKSIEAELHDLRPPVCNYDGLIACLKKNEKCMIRCKRYVDEFIGCVDAERVHIIKEKFEREKRSQSEEDSEENELANQFLKCD